MLTGQLVNRQHRLSQDFPHIHTLSCNQIKALIFNEARLSLLQLVMLTDLQTGNQLLAPPTSYQNGRLTGCDVTKIDRYWGLTDKQQQTIKLETSSFLVQSQWRSTSFQVQFLCRPLDAAPRKLTVLK